jgi:uracil-DNA glycosylase family 4
MISSCSKCELRNHRKQQVPGRGSIPADVLFIGDAPNAGEDALGEACVGQAGKLVARMMITIPLRTYYMNVVMCRCPDRDPTSHEVLTCMENILNIVEKIKPKYVVFLGKLAARYYKKHFPNSIEIAHPSMLLKTGGAASPLFLTCVRKLEELCLSN